MLENTSNPLTYIPEYGILIYSLIYKNYIRYNKYTLISKEIKEVYRLYKALQRLHDKEPNTDKTLDDLATHVWASYPQLRAEDKEALNLVLTTLRGVKLSDFAMEDTLRLVSERSKALQIATVALGVTEGRKSFTDLQDAFSAISEDSPTLRVEYVTDNLQELYETTILTPGLRWRLDCLNRSLGSLRKGDFGFVFARPETGKTTFLASEVTHMAQQAESPILWFNNEEQGNKVKVRCYQASLGITDRELFSGIARNQSSYLERTKGLITIYDDANIYKREVEAMIAEVKPALILFDQIDKIRGFDADRPDLVFGKIYQWGRELAKEFAPVIGTCQADGTGEGIRWLTMKHVAEAKTTKQAEADWILGIGRIAADGYENLRYLNISKNKLMGDEDSDPAKRHDRREILIKPEIARYVEIGHG